MKLKPQVAQQGQKHSRAFKQKKKVKKHIPYHFQSTDQRPGDLLFSF